MQPQICGCFLLNTPSPKLCEGSLWPIMTLSVVQSLMINNVCEMSIKLTH